MTTEYNKIHALAQARRKVIAEFGTDLRHFWPLVDDGALIRDLMRLKTLYGTGISVQQPGLLDYAIGMGEGQLADVTPDVGFDEHANSTEPPNAWAFAVPAGIYQSVDFELYYEGAPPLTSFWVAPANLPTGEIVSKAIDYWTTNSEGLVQHNFPSMLVAGEGQYWIYMQRDGSWPNSLSRSSGYPYTTAGPLAQYGLNDAGDEWVANYLGRYDRHVLLHGANDSENWPATDKLTLGVVVNTDLMDLSDVGTVVALCDGSEARARISIASGPVASCLFKPTTGSHSLTDTRRLHPGCNLITASYEKSVKVKLGVNGMVVAETTPGAYDLFGITLAMGVGAEVKTGGSVASQLTNGIVDDVFLAKGVVTDAKLREIFLAYITAAPLMQTTSV